LNRYLFVEEERSPRGGGEGRGSWEGEKKNPRDFPRKRWSLRRKSEFSREKEQKPIVELYSETQSERDWVSNPAERKGKKKGRRGN